MLFFLKGSGFHVETYDLLQFRFGARRELRVEAQFFSVWISSGSSTVC